MSQQCKVASYCNVLSERPNLTSLTFQTLESRNTQTAVSFVSKTGLTSCFVFARVISTGALRKINAKYVNFISYIVSYILDSLYMQELNNFTVILRGQNETVTTTEESLHVVTVLPPPPHKKTPFS